MITFNEERNIERCLKSVRWADEIIVVDSQSQDRTVDICKEYGAKIFERTFTNYSDQKNVALDYAAHEWVFSIDADEEVPDELAKEIERMVHPCAGINGYFVHRKSFIFGREFKFSGTQDDWQMRLFRKKKARFVRPVHETVEIQGNTGRLKCELLHYSYSSLADYMRKFHSYTSMEAGSRFDESFRNAYANILARPIFRFLRLYLWKQGFRDGFQGLLFSALSSFYDFVLFWKLIRIKHANQSSN